MDQLLKVLFLALLQGVTELFPVSSLGHTVILPALFGWGNLIKAHSFLPIVVTLHLGTALALLTFFWRDWLALLRALFKSIAARSFDADPQGKTIWLVIVGSIPVGLLGLILEKPVQDVFFAASLPVLPAMFLCVNGTILYVGERLRQRVEPMILPAVAGRAGGVAPMSSPAEVRGVAPMSSSAGVGRQDRRKQEMAFKTLDELSFKQALVIGAVQAAALLPGISRSGITMVASLRCGLRHADAARFTFLLATPAILGAGLLEVPKLLTYDSATLFAALLGGVLAGIAAFLSIKFLIRYFEVGRLTPFAYYCLAAGALTFALFASLSLGWISLPWVMTK